MSEKQTEAGMITRVASATIEVPDLDVAVRFYLDAIGLVETERRDGVAYLTCSARHHELALVESEGGETALRHLSLEVADGGLGALVAQAAAAGGEVLADAAVAGVREAVRVRGPEGFVYELVSGMDTVAEPPPGALPRPEQISHFNIGAVDVPATQRFLLDGLGFRPSDWLASKEDPLLAWLHCPAPRANHHGIAVLATPTARLHHLAFDYADIQAVADRLDHLTSPRHLVIWGMGRHGAGDSIFSYVEDPAGLMVELGTGMVRVGDATWGEPRIMDVDDPQGADRWGSQIPEPWMAHGIPLTAVRQGATT